MTHEEARAAVATALSDIAPEVDLKDIRGDRPLRDQAEIDSFDFINFLVRLHELTGIEIPESDYDRIRTLDQLLAYLSA
jgi:acyl carrier protein